MTAEALAAELAALKQAVATLPEQIEAARIRREGLLGYDGLRARLAVDGRMPCLRTVKTLARRYRAILRPVPLGHRTVGFRPASVDRLLAHLAGEPAGAAKL